MFNSCERPSILCKTLTAAGPQLPFAAGHKADIGKGVRLSAKSTGLNRAARR
jgi:hypothetical protein